jgi:hypothetical protein
MGWGNSHKDDFQRFSRHDKFYHSSVSQSMPHSATSPNDMVFTPAENYEILSIVEFPHYYESQNFEKSMHFQYKQELYIFPYAD